MTTKRRLLALLALLVTLFSGVAGLTAAHATTTDDYYGGGDAPVDEVEPVLGMLGRTTPPASADLTPWAVPVRSQGNVNSCATWAIDYAMLGWYSRRLGRAGQPFAPMFIYSQIAKGNSQAITTLDRVMDMTMAQGVDTAAHYTQGAYTNFTTQPTTSEQASAQKYKVAGGYTRIFSSSQANVGSAASQAIKAQLAAGHPVALMMRVRPGFKSLASGGVDNDTTGTVQFNHAVLAVGYNSSGILVQNSWGTGWASSGFGRLSYAVIQKDVYEGVVIEGFGSAQPHDLDGDNTNDVISRDGNGHMWFYPAVANGFLGDPQLLSDGDWSGLDQISITRDMNSDRRNDIIAREGNTLWLGEMDGMLGINWVSLGTSFGSYVSILAPGDFNGDGRSDIITETADGQLLLFAGNGNGTISVTARVIGHGWGEFDMLLAPGDFSGDGKADVIGRLRNGDLWLYRGAGTASGSAFGTSQRIGTGWNMFDRIVAPGDFNGDGKADLIGRVPDGRFILYGGNFTGFPNSRVLDGDWSYATHLA